MAVGCMQPWHPFPKSGHACVGKAAQQEPSRACSSPILHDVDSRTPRAFRVYRVRACAGLLSFLAGVVPPSAPLGSTAFAPSTSSGYTFGAPPPLQPPPAASSSAAASAAAASAPALPSFLNPALPAPAAASAAETSKPQVRMPLRCAALSLCLKT